mmetsp:Transcript_57680/g.185345  ORF Transcript_57680/g.185345 Transcript_57680/m.185345 type:complete len:209 (-) Transcript_57680:490-1116(-)
MQRMSAALSPEAAARAASSCSAGRCARSSAIHCKSVGKISAPPTEAATTSGKASSESVRPARARAPPMIRRISVAPGGSWPLRAPRFPNLPLARISLYSVVAAISISSSASDTTHSLPRSAVVTAEYMAVRTAVPGHARGSGPSKSGHKRDMASSVLAPMASALRLASSQAVWRSRITSAGPGSRTRNKKSPNGSLNETGRPEHSGSS